jgi:hypothetical protein
MNRRKWEFWRKVRDWCNRKMTSAWMEKGNCDSRCPQCNQWESRGNIIVTLSQDDGSELRICKNCDYEWKALFTPAGFIPIDQGGDT